MKPSTHLHELRQLHKQRRLRSQSTAHSSKQRSSCWPCHQQLLKVPSCCVLQRQVLQQAQGGTTHLK
jgi:hypothetical protein